MPCEVTKVQKIDIGGKFIVILSGFDSDREANETCRKLQSKLEQWLKSTATFFVLGARKSLEIKLEKVDSEQIIHQTTQPTTIWNPPEDIKPSTIIVKEKDGTYTHSGDGGLEWTNCSFDDLPPFLQLAWLAHEYAIQKDEIDKLPEVTGRAYSVIDKAWREISEMFFWGDKGITIIEK